MPKSDVLAGPTTDEALKKSVARQTLTWGLGAFVVGVVWPILDPNPGTTSGEMVPAAIFIGLLFGSGAVGIVRVVAYRRWGYVSKRRYQKAVSKEREREARIAEARRVQEDALIEQAKVVAKERKRREQVAWAEAVLQPDFSPTPRTGILTARSSSRCGSVMAGGALSAEALGYFNSITSSRWRWADRTR